MRNVSRTVILLAALLLAVTARASILQTYEGPPIPADQAVRLLWQPEITVRGIDGRTLIVPAGCDVIELQPGRHEIRFRFDAERLKTTPSGDLVLEQSRGRNLFASFDGSPGKAYRLRMAVNPNEETGWATVDGDSSTSTPGQGRIAACWINELRGSVVARKSKEILTVRNSADGTEGDWHLVRPPLVLAVPRNALQRVAAVEPLIGGQFLYSVGGRSGLKEGKRIRAFYSTCQPQVLLEFIVDE